MMFTDYEMVMTMKMTMMMVAVIHDYSDDGNDKYGDSNDQADDDDDEYSDVLNLITYIAFEQT